MKLTVDDFPHRFAEILLELRGRAGGRGRRFSQFFGGTEKKLSQLFTQASTNAWALVLMETEEERGCCMRRVKEGWFL